MRQSAGTGLQLPASANLEQAARVLQDHGFEAAVRSSDVDLETIFLALTGRALRDAGDSETIDSETIDSETIDGEGA